MDWTRFPLLLVTAALLISGVLENELGSGNQAVLSVGFVCLGAWLAIEVQTWYQLLRKAAEKPSDEDDGGDA